MSFETVLAQARAEGRTLLNEVEAKSVLKEAGVSVANTTLARSRDEAQAQADTQPKVVEANRRVEIAAFDASAKVKQAEGDAQSKTINAEADAMVFKTVGEGEATKVRAVGIAEADVIKLKIASMQSGNYALIETAKALAVSGKLVPEIVAGGNGEEGGSLVSVLLANLIRDSLKSRDGGSGHAPEAVAIAPAAGSVTAAMPEGDMPKGPEHGPAK